MKRKITWAATLFVFVVAAFSAFAREAGSAKIDPPPGHCGYITHWLIPGGTGGENPCLPMYCWNQPAFGNENCYLHWGTPQTPTPPQCQ